MKRILINATQQEELRVGMVDGQRLYDLDIELPSRSQKKGNVYKGIIIRIEPSLEAAFVDYGSRRHGFLPFKEVARSYFSETADNDDGERTSIKDVLSEGQQVVVQVEREERGTKGAALTTFISLAGRYLVLMPNSPRAGGVSRRIEGEERDEIRRALAQLEMSKDTGVIVRTAGVGRSVEELQWDLNYLQQLNTAITKASESQEGAFLIYQESNVIIRTLRDHLRDDIGEIIIDDEDVYNDAKEFVERVMPHNLKKLKLYKDNVPLFNRYQIEAQIESAFDREVSLPSGGSIVIDHTEALISIDINSAKATKGASIEETALNINLEAVDEIARQLRLRDLGGLIVIDFIDMMSNKNQRDVESQLREALRIDRARVQLGRISRFGLLEMSRQRLRPSLQESSQIICPRCNGHGTIRSIESLTLAVLRLIEEEAMKEKTSKVIAKLPVHATSFLLNEKRSVINEIETRHGINLVIVPDPNLETPHFAVERIRGDDKEIGDKSSYDLIPKQEEPPEHLTKKPDITTEQPAVKSIHQTAVPAPAPPPQTAKPTKPGVFIRLFRWLTGSSDQTRSRQRSRQGQPRRRSRTYRGKRGHNGRAGGQRRRESRGDSRSSSNRQRGESSRRATSARGTSNRRNNRNHQRKSGFNYSSSQRNNPNRQSGQSAKSESSHLDERK